jgi:hypothetical protein
MTLLRIVATLALCGSAIAADWELWLTLSREAVRLSARGEFQAALPLMSRAVEEARQNGAPDERLMNSLDALGVLPY